MCIPYVLLLYLCAVWPPWKHVSWPRPQFPSLSLSGRRTPNSALPSSRPSSAPPSRRRQSGPHARSADGKNSHPKHTVMGLFRKKPLDKLMGYSTTALQLADKHRRRWWAQPMVTLKGATSSSVFQPFFFLSHGTFFTLTKFHGTPPNK